VIEHLVVVDDREDGRDIAASIADLLGLELLQFTHPNEALEPLLALDRPFILILDHNFEDDQVQGYHLCNELRQQHPFGFILPIIYLSGYMDGASFITLLHDQLMFAPTAFISKGDHKRLKPMVRSILNTFDGVIETAQRQVSAQALTALAEWY
jgi:CheY-like chemotaxis protein